MKTDLRGRIRFSLPHCYGLNVVPLPPFMVFSNEETLNQYPMSLRIPRLAHHIPTRPISKSCRFRLQTQSQSDQPSPSTAPGLTLTILASWMPGALPASPLPRVVLSPNNSQRGLCPWDMKHIFIFLFLSKFIYSKIHFLKWSCSVSCVTTITIRIQRI